VTLQLTNAWFPPFRCRSAVSGQPINVLVTSSLYVYGKTFPAMPFSRATATVATERKNGNGMVETRHYLAGSDVEMTVSRASSRHRINHRQIYPTNVKHGYSL